MPKFRLLIKQQGEGCDYTIGCGYRFSKPFEARDIKAAAAMAHRLLTHREEVMGADGEWTFPDLLKSDNIDPRCEGAMWREFKVETAIIVPAGVELPVEGWYHQGMLADKQAEASAEEAKEKAELKRLQAKYK